VKTRADWSAQDFKQADEMGLKLSQSSVFEDLAHTLHTDLNLRLDDRRGRRRGAGGECVKCRSERVCVARLGFSNLQ